MPGGLKQKINKMKSLQILSTALIMLAFTACKKDSNPTPATQPVSLIKTVTSSTNGAAATSNTYEYNADKTINKTKYDDGGYCNFIYSGQTVVADCYDKNGIATVKFNYNLNGAGLLSTLTLSTSASTIYYYDFNNAKQLVHATAKNNGVLQSEYFYKYNSDGNKITDSLISSNGTAINHYTYYTNKVSTTEQRNYGQPFYGVGNKNCVENTTLISTGGVTTLSPYGVPVLDAAGHIAQTSYTYYGNNTVTSYTYQ